MKKTIILTLWAILILFGGAKACGASDPGPVTPEPIPSYSQGPSPEFDDLISYLDQQAKVYTTETINKVQRSKKGSLRIWTGLYPDSDDKNLAQFLCRDTMDFLYQSTGKNPGVTVLDRDGNRITYVNPGEIEACH
jgi:hypothetical protein